MNNAINFGKLWGVVALAVVSVTFAANASADNVFIEETTVTAVAVGASSDPNGGVTCVKVAAPLAEVCNGYLAIVNNEKQMVAAALLNKVTVSPVWIYYVNNDLPDPRSGANQHCPGRAYTPCVLKNIETK